MGDLLFIAYPYTFSIRVPPTRQLVTVIVVLYEWSNLTFSWAHLPLFGTLVWPWPTWPLTLTHVTFDLEVNGSRDINFYLVISGPMHYFLVTDRQTDRRKAMHKSPPCMSTGGLKKGSILPNEENVRGALHNRWQFFSSCDILPSLNMGSIGQTVLVKFSFESNLIQIEKFKYCGITL